VSSKTRNPNHSRDGQQLTVCRHCGQYFVENFEKSAGIRCPGCGRHEGNFFEVQGEIPEGVIVIWGEKEL